MLMRCLYRQTLLSLLEIKLSTLFRPAFSTFALHGGLGNVESLLEFRTKLLEDNSV